MVNYARAFSQSELGKYFEWIIRTVYVLYITSLGIMDEYFWHKWRHWSCDMTSSIIASLSILNIWWRGEGGGGVDSPDHDITEFCRSTTSGNHTINHVRGTGKTIHNQPGTVQYFHT